MSELKRDYWSDTLVCITGKVKIDRREIAAVVTCKHYLDIHLKSGSIFTVKEWDVNTVANLYLVESPHEEVKVVPNTFTLREGHVSWDRVEPNNGQESEE